MIKHTCRWKIYQPMGENKTHLEPMLRKRSHFLTLFKEIIIKESTLWCSCQRLNIIYAKSTVFIYLRRLVGRNISSLSSRKSSFMTTERLFGEIKCNVGRAPIFHYNSRNLIRHSWELNPCRKGARPMP